MKKIAIDFGASRIKSVVFSQKRILSSFETLGSNIFEDKKINPKFFYNSLITHLDYHIKKHKINKITLCSEMHGYCLYNIKKKKLSNYFSWRHTKNHKKNIYKFKNSEFKKTTGLKARSGLPILDIMSNSKIKNFGEYFLCGIGEIICIIGGYYSGSLHSTYAQSTGFCNLKNKFYKKRFFFKNSIVSQKKNLIGKIIYNGKKISINGGYGDLQAAVLGSNLKKNQILLNMGTGSQIIIKSKKKITFLKKELILRIYFLV